MTRLVAGGCAWTLCSSANSRACGRYDLADLDLWGVVWFAQCVPGCLPDQLRCMRSWPHTGVLVCGHKSAEPMRFNLVLTFASQVKLAFAPHAYVTLTLCRLRQSRFDALNACTSQPICGILMCFMRAQLKAAYKHTHCIFAIAPLMAIVLCPRRPPSCCAQQHHMRCAHLYGCLQLWQCSNVVASGCVLLGKRACVCA